VSSERTVQIVVGALCVAALVGIIAVTSGGDLDETSARVLASALTLAVYLLLGLGGTAMARSGEAWSWLGGVAVTLCAAGALFTVWLWWVIDADGDDDSIAKAAGICALYAVATSHGSLLLRRIQKRAELGQTARYLTFGCGLLLATLLTADILSDDGEAVDPQLLAVLAILYVLGTVVSPLLRLAEPKSPPTSAETGG
jgi:hypothetical protein